MEKTPHHLTRNPIILSKIAEWGWKIPFTHTDTNTYILLQENHMQIAFISQRILDLIADSISRGANANQTKGIFKWKPWWTHTPVLVTCFGKTNGDDISDITKHVKCRLSFDDISTRSLVLNVNCHKDVLFGSFITSRASRDHVNDIKGFSDLFSSSRWRWSKFEKCSFS